MARFGCSINRFLVGPDLGAPAAISTIKLVSPTVTKAARIPRWMSAVFAVSLFGGPARESAEQQRKLWHQHFSEMRADPSAPPHVVGFAALHSSISHIAWRLKAGPSTTVAPGILCAAAGLISLCLAFSPTYALAGSTPSSGVLGILGGALLVLEARPKDRSTLTRALWAAITLGLFVLGFDYWINPLVSGDKLAALSFLLIGISVSPHASSKRRTPGTWRRWAVFGLALGILGFSNFVIALQVDDSAASSITFALFVAELAAAVVVLRWAAGRRSLTMTTIAV